MYLRFLQLFLNSQIENLEAVFNDEYDTPSHTKKVFANIRRKGKDFSGTVTPLFATMLIQPQADAGEDETIHEERGDNMERVTTTAASLDAEQDSGSRPRCQDTILGDRLAQTRFERLSKHSNDPPLSTFNTLGSGEDSMKLNELMEICTRLSERVLALENIKTAQDLEITNINNRVKKLEKKTKSRTPQLQRRLFKVRIESSAEKSSEDLETHGRYGHDIGVNIASTSITTASINITTAEPVTTASALITTAGVSVSTAEPSTPPTTTILIEDEDLAIAQTLMKTRSMKSIEKSKEKGVSSETATTTTTRGVTMQEPSESGIRKIVPPPQHDPKDKGKAKMIELESPLKKKDHIKFDEEMAKRLTEELQAELEEEERVARQREEEANLIS
ncbi:hypothetical protein Tco_1481069 [Tanacetum coccineum]